MEDIKILEEILTRDIEDTEGTKIMKKAIQNLIARYKELEEKQNKNIQVAYGGRRYNTEGIVIENHLPKSKVQEKIKELLLGITEWKTYKIIIYLNVLLLIK